MRDETTAFMARHGICLLLAGSLDSGVITSQGELPEEAPASLVKGLFGSKEALLRLDASLVGQIMPTVWGQGDVRVVVCKPNKHLLVGAVTTKKWGPAELYQWSKAIDKEIRSLHSRWSIVGATDAQG